MIRYLKQNLYNLAGNRALPLELIVFVTDRCPFTCAHCFIRRSEDKPARDLSLDVINRLAKDLPDLMVLMLTGGEPFVREDLPQVVRIFSEHSRPHVISIATNGFLTDRIIRSVQDILTMKQCKSKIIVTVSFEGLSQAHNTNRKCDRAFENALETAKELGKLKQSFKNLSVGANLTLIPGNEKDIIELAWFLEKSNLFSFVSHNIYRETKPMCAFDGIRPGAYAALSKTVEEMYKKFCFDAGSLLGVWHKMKERYQSDIIHRTCREQRYQGVSCEAGRGIGVVYNDGRVAPCEMLPADWGNIHMTGFSEIWNDEKNRKRSRTLRTEKCFCTHECFLSASLNLHPVSMMKCMGWNVRDAIGRD
ncbi:MAG: radical SAM protein [Desulfobacteraceae bacterium]